MSKGRKRHFKAQSHVTANYMDSFLRSKSGDTDEEKPDEVTEGSLAATAANVPRGNTATKIPTKHRNVFRLVMTIISAIVIIYAFGNGILQIGRYFWNLEHRVSTTSGQVSKIEITLNKFSAETKEWRNNIVDSMSELRSKLNTFIEGLSKPPVL